MPAPARGVRPVQVDTDAMARQKNGSATGSGCGDREERPARGVGPLAIVIRP